MLERIETLVGAKEFKDFVKEIVKLAPEIKKKHSQDVFMSQSYLFSIGDGGGLTTYLESFATLIDVLGLASMSALSPVAEIKLDLTGKPVDDLSPVYEILSNGDAELVRVLCIDISKWIDKTDTEVFKKLLKDLQKASDKFIFAFRVPFVDKDVLGRVATSLNDLMSVRVLPIPPFDNVQTKEIARRDLQNYGLEMSVAAWQCFFSALPRKNVTVNFTGLTPSKRLSKSLCTKSKLLCRTAQKTQRLSASKTQEKYALTKTTKAREWHSSTNLSVVNKSNAKSKKYLRKSNLQRLKADLKSRVCICVLSEVPARAKPRWQESWAKFSKRRKYCA